MNRKELEEVWARHPNLPPPNSAAPVPAKPVSAKTLDATRKAILQAVAGLTDELRDELDGEIKVIRTSLEKLDDLSRVSTELAGNVKAVSDAILQVQKDVTAGMDDLNSRLDGLDDNEILNSATHAIVTANLQSLQTYADDILLRKSVYVSGDRDLPLLKGLIR